ncbi:MAG TPA: RecQ family zinc-binding domain-containing protein, partial [Pirellulales bacterium]|nr:RecQ family zinc-binding domain-containing protein [Pirellulales bacterium]
DHRALAGSLFAQLEERETRDIARLNQVLELAGLDGCQVMRLCEHFGERRSKPCGHCTWCLNGQRPTPLPPRRQATIDEDTWRQAQALVRRNPEVLGEPRALARFLCGMTSPRLSAAKLGKDPLFGSLADVPFAKVLERAEVAQPQPQPRRAGHAVAVAM